MDSVENLTLEALTTLAANWNLPLNTTGDVASGETNDSVMYSPTERVIRYPRAATVFAAACCVLFVVVGVLGNVLTMVALSRCAKLRNATTSFVISLCTADLLFCAINLPLTASRYIHEDWLLGDALCRLFPFFFYGNVAASLMSMVAITINRYVLINHYDVYDKIYRRKVVILMIIAYWTFSFGMLVPPLAGVWGRLGYHPETFSCTILSHNDKSPKKFLFILGFLLPCLVIIVSYSCIFYKVRRNRQSLTTDGTTSRNGTSSAPAVTTAPFNSQGQLRPVELHLTRLMLVIFCSFLLCFLPLMVVNVFDTSFKYPSVHVVASILAWMSSVINPFIYATMSRQYRQTYVSLLCPWKTAASVTRSSVSSSRSSSYSKTLVSDVFRFNAATNELETKKQPETDVATD